jgi:hypothetical protein
MPELDHYPIAVIEDRYRGTYSRGMWLAISVADQMENGSYRVVRCLEGGPHGETHQQCCFGVMPRIGSPAAIHQTKP